MLCLALVVLTLTPFGGCGTSWPDPSAVTVGVACGVPNSITCDRVGVGVWLWRPAKEVVAYLAGRPVGLSSPSSHPRTGLWLGYLYRAGLRRGPLSTHRSTRWFGDPPVSVPLRLVIVLADGSIAGLNTCVDLHPGFG